MSVGTSKEKVRRTIERQGTAAEKWRQAEERFREYFERYGEEAREALESVNCQLAAKHYEEFARRARDVMNAGLEWVAETEKLAAQLRRLAGKLGKGE